MAGPYSLIYADPPWRYRATKLRGCAEEHYPTMKTADIAALPVAALAADPCVLFMWGTWPNLPDALQVISGWGFEYKTVGFVWVKTPRRRAQWQIEFSLNTEPKTFLGLGFYTRGNSEFCLIGIRGKPKRINASVRQLIFAPLTRHSAKPPETRDRIVQLCGDLPRVELFARNATPGWDVWGNEVSSTINL
jgi:N6-adenosine-specific RNA methylase IME4